MTPESGERWLVHAIALSSSLFGAWLILGLEAPILTRLCVVSGWMVYTGREMWRQQKGYARVCWLKIDTQGRVVAGSTDGHTQQLTLQAGSVVLAKMAWLKLRFSDGHCYGEFFAARSERRCGWHGLQLIWQQRRGSFGGHD